jgi:hypothetical protein
MAAYHCKQDMYTRVYKHVGAISNICCNLGKHEDCVCIDVQGISEYTHRMRQVHGEFGSTVD